jgi:hypothetical protein
MKQQSKKSDWSTNDITQSEIQKSFEVLLNIYRVAKQSKNTTYNSSFVQVGLSA